MTPKELAAKLHGMEYRDDIPKDLLAEAKKSRLIIIYGASDDLMEFSGAIYDELGAGTAFIDSEGLLPDFENIDKDAYDGKKELKEYFRREPFAKPVEALWCETKEINWTYKTDIPHETFDIMEDGEIYCRGIVISLDNLGGERLPDFGVLNSEFQGVKMSCPAIVPGLSLQDLMMVFEEAEKAAGPRNSLAGNPSEWPNVQGIKAVAQAVAVAMIGWKK